MAQDSHPVKIAKLVDDFRGRHRVELQIRAHAMNVQQIKDLWTASLAVLAKPPEVKIIDDHWDGWTAEQCAEWRAKNDLTIPERTERERHARTRIH